jgi:3-deoxy-manno-octulosonate cytidylyltransferase (CMP-KDO synthetase)
MPFEQNPTFDISTVGFEMHDPEEINNQNIVKIVFGGTPPIGQGLYFTRGVPYGEGAFYHHVGIYAYRRQALERFVKLPPSTLEKRERLEQLRALENGMTIGVAIADEGPLGVDTPADLERVRAILKG